MQNYADLQTVEKIQRIVKDNCNINRLIKFGETSSESTVYLLSCTNDSANRIAKVSNGHTDFSSEIKIMSDPYMQKERLCPELYQHTKDIIIMEYIPNTLARWLAELALSLVTHKNAKRQPHNEVLQVTDSLVKKLFKYHIRYTHGDLHSNNILVNPATFECFIIDFTSKLEDHDSSPDANKFALNNLSMSFYIYTLDICLSVLKSKESKEYKTCEAVVKMFDTVYKTNVNKIYGITLDS